MPFLKIWSTFHHVHTSYFIPAVMGSWYLLHSIAWIIWTWIPLTFEPKMKGSPSLLARNASNSFKMASKLSFNCFCIFFCQGVFFLGRSKLSNKNAAWHDSKWRSKRNEESMAYPTGWDVIIHWCHISNDVKKYFHSGRNLYHYDVIAWTSLESHLEKIICSFYLI